MVMPEHVKFSIEPSGGGQGTQSHFGIAWIDHNDAQIARNVLAGFLTMGRDPRRHARLRLAPDRHVHLVA